jgi:hypothetical protein
MSSLHAGRPVAALAIPWAQSSSLWEQEVWPGGSAVVDRNQLFDSPFPGKGLEAGGDAPTRYAGRHGRTYLAGERGWCHFGSHLALYILSLLSLLSRGWKSGALFSERSAVRRAPPRNEFVKHHPVVVSAVVHRPGAFMQMNSQQGAAGAACGCC